MNEFTPQNSSKKDKKNDYRRISLFSPLFIFLIGMCACGVIFVFWRLSSVNPSDIAEYHQLVADAELSHSTADASPYKARQERKGVCKDLIFHKGPQRLQIRIDAAAAQLVLDHQEIHTSIVEHMQKVKCYMQEELYYLLPDGSEALLQPNGKLLVRQSDPLDPQSWYSLEDPRIQPMQIMRFLEAEEAEYYYKSDRFVADSVKVTRYAASGHELMQDLTQAKILMKGFAQKVEFSLQGPQTELQFQAHHLKATFFDLEGLNL
ncbi:MAG: hypothetical protein BGO14_08150 [Chlamydiales bacterium 38-26]|nr:hypothetical protein [Chlamydiales bacterium]OJV10963.1 MAG: hypothetical protein BGO14_08150 [Chlamydiales bacterium 38-26]